MKRIFSCNFALLLTAVFLSYNASAQQISNTAIPASDTTAQVTAVQKEAPTEKKSKWYDKISLRGYAQIRYNRLLETNDQLKAEQADRSLGNNNTLFIRRARLVISGDVSERLSIYIQPDFAVSSGSSLNFLQLRDAYFDLALDKQKAFRLRFGQSKIPYGFENLQSSSNRLTLDRNDALNSALANERDLAIMFYWAPPKIRERFKELTDSGLKGSGDYGMFGLGLFTGQTANKAEANDDMHTVARFSYPMQLPNGQFIEAGIQGYTGKYVVTPDQLSTGVTATPEQLSDGFKDQRVAASLIIYPQPFGFQAEYNIGEGPEFDLATSSIKVKSLHGGYAQAMYMLQLGDHVIIPFAKIQYYDGGKKHERDATSHLVYETEIGAEWQPFKNFELVAQYTISDRTTRNITDLNNRQHGNRLRLQAQFNF